MSDRFPPYVRNYTLLAADGGLFMGGMAFIAPATVMPLLIAGLNGPNWVIAFMPTLMMIGFTIPQVFIAHLVEQLRQLKPWLISVGLVQRLPIGVAAVALLFFAQDDPGVTLLLVATAPLVSGLFGGLTATAFLELYARSVPAERRASLGALRNSIKDCIGLFAGGGVFAILAAIPGTDGFGVLHLITFTALMMSWAMFLMVDEPRPEKARPVRTLAQNFARMPALIRAQLGLRRVILARVFGAGMFMAIPFLVGTAQERLQVSDAVMGSLITWQMAGGLLGNLLAGWWGDRHGPIGVAVASPIAFILLATIAWGAESYVAWGIVFAFLGATLSFMMIGNTTLTMELFPPQDRPTCQAMTALSSTAAMVPAGFIAAWLIDVGGLALNLLLGGLTAVAATYFFLRIPNPRRQKPTRA